MKKLFLLVAFTATLGAANCSYAMGESLICYDQEQSTPDDKRLITINLQNDQNDTLFSINIPYEALTLSSTLLHALGDCHDEGDIITISVDRLPTIKIPELCATLELLQLFYFKKLEEKYVDRVLTKKSIIKLLDVASYFDCPQLEKILVRSFNIKTERLIFEKNKLKKGLRGVQTLEGTDHYPRYYRYLYKNFRFRSYLYDFSKAVTLQENFFPFTFTCENAAWNHDLSYFVYLPADKTIRVFDRKANAHHTFEGHTDRITQVKVVHEKFKKFISSSADTTIKIWDLDSSSYVHSVEGHGRPIKDFIISDDQELLISYDDRSIKLWDLTTRKCLHTLAESADVLGTVILSQDKTNLISCSENMIIRKWDVKTGQCLFTLNEQKEYSNIDSYYTTMRYFDNDKKLALNTIDGVKIWDVATGNYVRTLQQDDLINAYILSQDETTIATYAEDMVITLWDAITGKRLHELDDHSADIQKIIFSNNGNTLISCSSDSTIKIWDVKTGECVQSLDEHTKEVYLIMALDDGNTVISCSNDQTIKIWDIKKGQCLQTIHYPTKIANLFLSPDGNNLLLFDSEKHCIVYNIPHLKSLTPLTLLLLSYLVHNKEKRMLQKLPSEEFYCERYALLPQKLQEIFAHVIHQESFKIDQTDHEKK